MSTNWLVAWGQRAVTLAAASLVAPLYIVALGETTITLDVVIGVEILVLYLVWRLLVAIEAIADAQQTRAHHRNSE